VTSRIRPTLALFLIAIPTLSLVSCVNDAGRKPARDTWVDPDASVPMIDVAIAKPRVAVKQEGLISLAMREAGRRYMIDEKGYSVLANEVTDAALAAAGMDASGDASAASQVVDADAVILINITRWDTSELIPRGRIYATGTIRAAGKPNGRRVFEYTFQDQILLAPSQLTPLNRDEAEKQMAADLVTQSLASFRKKS
jgi:hypothetical protein